MGLLRRGQVSNSQATSSLKKSHSLLHKEVYRHRPGSANPMDRGLSRLRSISFAPSNLSYRVTTSLSALYHIYLLLMGLRLNQPLNLLLLDLFLEFRSG